MLKLTIDEHKICMLEPGDRVGTGMIDGVNFNADILSGERGHIHVILDNQSVNVEILEIDRGLKKVKLKVNGAVHHVIIQDKFDLLLKELGMEVAVGKEHRDIKAPMPGLVIDVMVEIGQEVEKDSPVIILEAMKMENVIKSPSKGTVSQISVIKGQAVEKNQVLIAFE